MELIHYADSPLALLTPYSPSLNIIECLWKPVNEEVRSNKYLANVSELRTALTEIFMQRLSKLAVNPYKRFANNLQVLSMLDVKPVS